MSKADRAWARRILAEVDEVWRQDKAILDSNELIHFTVEPIQARISWTPVERDKMPRGLNQMPPDDGMCPGCGKVCCKQVDCGLWCWCNHCGGAWEGKQEDTA